jgi:imidazolonepropionase-like amidohydrolase
MPRIARVLMMITVASCMFATQRAIAQTPPTAITHVTVVDVITGGLKPDMTIVVTGNQISQVGPSNDVAVPTNARIVEGRGKFLIPGLWDMHVHLGNATEAALPVLVANGITGVRDMGSPSFETLRHWRIQALKGDRIAPRIVAPGPILTMGPPYFWEMVVHNAEEGRKAVDMLTEEGVDFIKITQSLDRETYFAIADEARKLDIPLVGHLPVNENGMGYKVSGTEASNAGQKCFEHLQGIPFPFEPKDPDLIPTLLKNGTWIDPTIVTYWSRAHVQELAAAQDDPRLKHIAPGFKQFWDSQLSQYPKDNKISLQVLQWRMEQIAVLFKAGVPLLAGTDLGFAYIYPGDLIKELELFVQAGLPPLDALRTATINPARFLNKDKELGSVDARKLADLVLLDGNPLDAIHNLHLVHAVVLNGRFFDRAQLDAMLPTF